MRDRIEKRPLPKFKFEKADLEEMKDAMQADWTGLNWAIGKDVLRPPRGRGQDVGQGAGNNIAMGAAGLGGKPGAGIGEPGDGEEWAWTGDNTA